MIRQIHIQNYKALRDVTLDLTPFHVLIGPNDSGKTSILEAVGALCRSVSGPPEEWFGGNWQGSELVWNGGDPRASVRISASATNYAETGDYNLTCRFGRSDREFEKQFSVRAPGKDSVDLPGLPSHVVQLMASTSSFPAIAAARWAQSALGGVGYYRFNPRRLALPVAFDPVRRVEMDPSGFGLAICLEDMLGTQRSAYDVMEQRFKSIFPQIKEIQLWRVEVSLADPDVFARAPVERTALGKEIRILFSNSSTPVPASQVSDGILLTLAYLTVLHSSQSPRALLVEEPETGIYPRLLQKVLAILRDLVREQGHSQVIMTTHSPYVLDEFKPEEVTLCRKESDGSISVHPLSKSKTVQSQLDIFSLGEIWTSEDDESLASTDEPAKEPAQ